MKNCKLIPLFLVAAGFLGARTQARVTRIDVTTREVVADGMAFGETGPYEKLRGTVYFEVDPLDPRNSGVFDLDKAPRSKSGLVELSADMFILKPVDLSRGNNGLFYEVNARGGKVALGALCDARADANANNPTDARDFGNGFLLRRGYTIAWVGWEADIAAGGNRSTVQFPIAMENNEPINEKILIEFADARGASVTDVFTLPLGGGGVATSYEAVSTDPVVADAELRVRPSDSPRPSAPDIPEGEIIPATEWSFARCPTGPPGAPSTTDICVAGGFRNDRIYQLTYKATRSPVMGLGYVTTRDFLSFLRYATIDDVGTANPIPGVERALGFGGSQSAQYLRDYLYQGFNEDELGQRVFDGVYIASMGVNKMGLSYRFAQPSPGMFQHKGRYKPDTNFPRTYEIRENPLNPGQFDGILKRPATDPKVIHTNSSTEYWQYRASLLDTDEDGTVDLLQPANVRRYSFAGTQHFAIKGARPTHGIGDRQCQQLSNPTFPGLLLRALLISLDQWVGFEIAPPESRVPRIRDGTLISPELYCDQFPQIPMVNCNRLYNASGERDFGPRVIENRGVVDYLNPLVDSVHQVLVPTVDDLGNDVAGIRHPFVEAPVATLTGWNLRTPEFTEGDLCDANGMMIPLRRTRDERLAAGDPRPSLEELYGDHTGYVLKVAEAALTLWSQRLMLLEDVFEVIQEADDSDVLR